MHGTTNITRIPIVISGAQKSFTAVILQKSEIKVGKFVPLHVVKECRGVER